MSQARPARYSPALPAATAAHQPRSSIHSSSGVSAITVTKNPRMLNCQGAAERVSSDHTACSGPSNEYVSMPRVSVSASVAAPGTRVKSPTRVTTTTEAT